MSQDKDNTAARPSPGDADGDASHHPAPAGGGILRWLILAAVVAAAFWFGLKALREAPEAGAESAGGGAAAGGPPPATVLVAQVEKRSAQETRRVSGTLRAVARAEVAAREMGVVAEVKVDEGSVVKKDAVLAVIDGRRLDAELAEAGARLTAARSLIAQRKAEAKRALSDLASKKSLLEDSGAVSEREFLDAVRDSAVAAARATEADNELAALTSAIELLNVRHADLEILAPFAGRIVERHVEPGEWVAAGGSVVTLVSTGEIEAWLEVPERYAASFTENGGHLSVVAENAELESKVNSLRKVADIDPRTRLFPVVATMDDLDGAMISGMSVYVDLPVSEPTDHLAIPVDALVVVRDQAFVFRPAPGQGSGPQPPIAEKVTVSELFRRDGLVFVESDQLKAGDLVIVEGNERLFPGTPLIIPSPDTSAVPPQSEPESPSAP